MYMYIMYMYRLIWLQLKPSHCRQQRGGGGGHIRTCGGGGNLPVIGEEYIFAERHCKERCGRMERYLFGKTYSNRLYLELISLEFSRCLQQDAGCIHRIHAIIFQIYKLIAIRILKGILLE